MNLKISSLTGRTFTTHGSERVMKVASSLLIYLRDVTKNSQLDN